jgi:hypothetical protein
MSQHTDFDTFSANYRTWSKAIVSRRRVSLANVKIVASLSEETTCFTATLLVDGVKRGTVSNRGNGGSHEYTDRTVEAELAEMWAEVSGEVMNYGWADSVVDAVLTQHELRQKISRLLASRLMWVVTAPDGEVSVRETKRLTKDEMARHLPEAMKRHGHALLNTRSIDHVIATLDAVGLIG